MRSVAIKQFSYNIKYKTMARVRTCRILNSSGVSMLK